MDRGQIYFFLPGIAALNRSAQEGFETAAMGLEDGGMGVAADAGPPDDPLDAGWVGVGGGAFAEVSAELAGALSLLPGGPAVELPDCWDASSHWTMSDTRRFEGSSGLEGTRSI